MDFSSLLHKQEQKKKIFFPPFYSEKTINKKCLKEKKIKLYYHAEINYYLCSSIMSIQCIYYMLIKTIMNGNRSHPSVLGTSYDRRKKY